VFPTVASRFNDPGVNRLFAAICAAKAVHWPVSDVGPTELTARDPLIPGSRVRYLAEIAQSGRATAENVERQALAAERAHSLYESLKALNDAPLPAPLDRYPDLALGTGAGRAVRDGGASSGTHSSSGPAAPGTSSRLQRRSR
jgi:methylmalonyl-CoA mutase